MFRTSSSHFYPKTLPPPHGDHGSSACICWAKADLIRTWSLELTSSTHLGIFLPGRWQHLKKPRNHRKDGIYIWTHIYGDSLKKKRIEQSLWDSQYLDEPMDMSWLRRKFMRLLDGRHRPSQFWPKNWVHPKTHPATNGDVYFSTSQISQVWIASPLFCWT